MSKRCESCTVVELNGVYASVHFADGLKVERELLDRSSLLRHALAESEDTNKVPLAVPQEFLQSWLQWRTNESRWDSSCFSSDMPQIAKFLEAADYLGDEEGCRKLCRQAAQGMIPQPPSQSPVTTGNLQVLEALPRNLLESIFAACDSSLSHILWVTPPHLHKAALNGAYPSIAANATIKLSPRDVLVWRRKAKRLWGLLSQISSLRHLQIEVRQRNPRISLPCSGSLSGLTALTYLSVTGATLPVGDGDSGCNGWGVGHLSMLGHLGLVDVNIGPLDASLLATQLVQLQYLQHLDLSRNNLSCGAVDLAPCLSKLSCLQHLALAHNNIDLDSVHALVPSIATLSSLTHLDLAQVAMSQRGEKVLAPMLVSLPKLQHLDVSMCSISEHILGQVSSLTDLRHLILAMPMTRDALLSELPSQLGAMTRLNTLNVSMTAMTEGELMKLAPSFGQLSALRALDISYSFFGSEGIKVLVHHISSLTDLVTLRMGGRFISQSGVSSLVQYLKTLTDLRHVYIDWLWPSASAVLELAECMGHLTAITHLNLPLDYEPDGGPDTGWFKIWEALAQSLSRLTCLQVLQLSSNDCLTRESVRLLAPAIGRLPRLEDLRFHGGKSEYIDADGGIVDEGMLALCPYLAGLSELQKLHLHVPALTAEGFEALFSTLEQLPALCSLHIPEGEVDGERLRLLLGSVARHRSLYHVELDSSCSEMYLVLSEYPDAQRLLSYCRYCWIYKSQCDLRTYNRYNENLKAAGVCDPAKLMSVTSLDVVRSNTFVSELEELDMKFADVPVIGSHSGVTIFYANRERRTALRIQSGHATSNLDASKVSPD